jgi:putative ABC transport system permease protein
MLGHLTVSKRSSTGEGAAAVDEPLLESSDIAAVEHQVAAGRSGLVVAPRLKLTGLLSNGRESAVFIADSVRPEDMVRLRGTLAGSGMDLSGGRPENITVSTGLADKLGLGPGSAASVLVSTRNGQVNALDVTVQDVFSTGNSGTNDKTVVMPLELARILDDSEGRADRLTILEEHAGPQEVERLRSQVEQVSPSLEVRTWYDLSSFYRQVKGLFDTIFLFVFVIVMTIVVMSVSNSMSMSVVERTREIGTLRAIGMQRRDVERVFIGEAVVLVAVGLLLGAVLAALCGSAINAAGLKYRPPTSTDAVPLSIGIDFWRSAGVATVLVAVGCIAAFIPARRAGRNAIVTSLGHV